MSLHSDGYQEEYLEDDLLVEMFSEHESDYNSIYDEEEIAEEVEDDIFVEEIEPQSNPVPAPLGSSSVPDTSSITPVDNKEDTDFTHIPVSSQLNPTWLELLKLKTQNSLSTIAMNQIISMFKRIKLEDLPKKYEVVEDTINCSNTGPVSHTLNGKPVYYFPIHRWLHIIVMLNLLGCLIVTHNSSTSHYQDMSTGSWFPGFLSRVPDGYTPLALDIYYDHFGVSNSDKLGGLYFSIANLPPDILMKPDNKFVLCLVPTGVNVQDVLRLVLNDFIFYQGKFTITISGLVYKLYCEIARLIGDIPGLAELCACLNHSAISPC